MHKIVEVDNFNNQPSVFGYEFRFSLEKFIKAYDLGSQFVIVFHTYLLLLFPFISFQFKSYHSVITKV